MPSLLQIASNFSLEIHLIVIALISLIFSFFTSIHNAIHKTLFFVIITLLCATVCYDNWHYVNIFSLLTVCLLSIILCIHKYYNSSNISNFSAYFLVITSFVGLLFSLKSKNFLSLYLSFEVISFTGYTMVTLLFKKPLVSEASIKYFIIGSVSSAIMLFGISFIYGGSNSILFSEVQSENPMVTVGLILFLAGIFFKISAFPLHFWAPDVYSLASIPSLSVISIVPKIAGIMALTNILPYIESNIVYITLTISCILSMIIGSVGGIFQSHIHKIIAYSGITNMGFILSAVVLPQIHQSVIVEYTVIYSVSLLFLFTTLLGIRKSLFYDGTLASIAGLYKNSPYLSFFLSIALLNLAGIPPLAGFFAKYIIIKELILQNNFYLPIFVVFASVVSLFYYLKIIKTIYFSTEANNDSVVKKNTTLPIYLLITLLCVFVVCYVFIHSHNFYTTAISNFI